MAARLLISLWICLGACVTKAAEPALAELYRLLKPLRLQSPDDWRGFSPSWYSGPSKEMRFAAPELMRAKLLLADWIGRRLATLPEKGDIIALQRTLNDELYAADLFCLRRATDAMDRCQLPKRDRNAIGFLHPEVNITRAVAAA